MGGDARVCLRGSPREAALQGSLMHFRQDTVVLQNKIVTIMVLSDSK